MIAYRPSALAIIAVVIMGCLVAGTAMEASASLVPLKRLNVPVMKNGQLVSYKTTYSGRINLGTSHLQEFSVVFDTGSGHVVVPSLDCKSKVCQKHRRYDIAVSPEAYPVNVDGSLPAETRDEVQIGYGTGTIKGEFVHEKVCLGADRERCADLSIVVATEMSANPFDAFEFDGIFGLGLSSLSSTPAFSFFGRLAEQRGAPVAAAGQFGIYLSNGDQEEGSELAVAGYNAARLREPLSWAPVAKPELGFWQVAIKAVRVGNKTLDICGKGNCRGIVDTGSSHLGVPRKHMPKIFTMLSSRPKGAEDDCRQTPAPTVQLELENGFSLTLNSEDYMRRLSTVDTRNINPAGQAPSRSCRPKVVPVTMPEQFGPNVFVLGEPVLLRYYTAFDGVAQRIGFAQASHDQALERDANALNDEDTIILVQVTVTVTPKRYVKAAPALAEIPEDDGEMASLLANGL